MSNDRLDQKPSERGGDPERRQIVEARSERLENPAHVRCLEREPDLDPEKTEGNIPQGRGRLPRLLHHFRPTHSPSPAPLSGYPRCSCIGEDSYRSAREIAR